MYNSLCITNKQRVGINNDFQQHGAAPRRLDSYVNLNHALQDPERRAAGNLASCCHVARLEDFSYPIIGTTRRASELCRVCYGVGAWGSVGKRVPDSGTTNQLQERVSCFFRSHFLFFIFIFHFYLVGIKGKQVNDIAWILLSTWSICMIFAAMTDDGSEKRSPRWSGKYRVVNVHT